MNKRLVAWITEQKQVNQTLIVGISGAQGTGKSTLCQRLKILLNDRYEVAILSLDDLYLSQYKRRQLAASISPLFATRGVPSTHDVNLGIQILEKLKQGQGDLWLPRFDKQTDNPKPKVLWECCKTPVDIVLFEGWCLGLTAQTDDALVEPINRLEANEDANAVWRKQVNQSLKGEYQALFHMIDKLIYLKAPNLASVFAWRKQQEQETFAHHPSASMDEQALRRFMAHYERLTAHGLTTLPKQAAVVVHLGEEHQCLDIWYQH